jgi:hypothetical protein
LSVKPLVCLAVGVESVSETILQLLLLWVRTEDGSHGSCVAWNPEPMVALVVCTSVLVGIAVIVFPM